MSILEFMSAHPVLTGFLAVMVVSLVVGTAEVIFCRGKHDL